MEDYVLFDIAGREVEKIHRERERGVFCREWSLEKGGPWQTRL